MDLVDNSLRRKLAKRVDKTRQGGTVKEREREPRLSSNFSF
jgi:hypothetical protein